MLKLSGKLVPRNTVGLLSIQELHSPVEVKKREVFDSLIRKTSGLATFKPSEEKEVKEDFIEYEEEEEYRVTPEIENLVDSEGKPTCQHPDYDKIKNAEVTFRLN